MFQCPVCEKSYPKLDSLRIHASKSHKISSEDLYNQVILKGKSPPKCQCGCGGTVRFVSLHKGYEASFIKGHSGRVNNNWGHNESARKKSIETRRKMYGSGELSSWRKGLTIETDERIARSVEKMKNTILNNPDERQRRSDHMKNQWATQNLMPLTGSDHSQWKGGTSELGTMCHASNHLYEQWKLPILKSAGFKCTKCEETKNLHVHHDQERMADIIHKFREDIDKKALSFEEKNEIVESVVNYHIEESVSGQVLCESCHKNVHESLNFKLNNHN